MIKIENIETYGWEAAIRGMRNPKNSWVRSDSCTQGFVWCNEFCGEPKNGCDKESGLFLGQNDYKLMKSLVNAGTDHRKFMRMITVTMDITAPLYWWKEFDTYKVGTVEISCSTMHKLTEKEFTIDDFSHDRLNSFSEQFLIDLIRYLNICRSTYNEAKNSMVQKSIWYQMIQLLPTSYNQRRTVQLNYEVLRNMYHARKNHKLDEWRKFCKQIEEMPYAEKLICGEREKDESKA